MLNIDKFLEYLCSELNRSPRTVESYRDDLIHFEKFAKGLSDSFSWETVDSDMVRNWMESMMDKGNSAATVERRLSALKTFYRFALARHYVESDPVYSIKGPKKEKPLPQFVKESEMDELLDRRFQRSLHLLPGLRQAHGLGLRVLLGKKKFDERVFRIGHIGCRRLCGESAS